MIKKIVKIFDQIEKLYVTKYSRTKILDEIGGAIRVTNKIVRIFDQYFNITIEKIYNITKYSRTV